MASHGIHCLELTMTALCGLKNLQELDLSNSDIVSLPQCLGNLTSLRVLDLSSTPLTGKVPSFITSLKSLEYISLVDTEIGGSFSFNLMANHSKLEVFEMSSISGNLHVETESQQWFPTFQLKIFQLENCHLNAQQSNVIPSFLQYQHELRLIDLSHNKLQGYFPSWLINNNPKLETLRLTNNSLTGSFDQLPTFVHGLQSLQISCNKIVGQLPNNIGKIFPNLIHMNLSENYLEGNLPSSMVEMQRVQTLDLSHNQFSGGLARNIFSNWTSLMLLSLCHNNFSGQLVPMFAKSARLQFLFLNDNQFFGVMNDGIVTKSSLLAMDVSNNNLSIIPRWIGNLSSIRLLSMSSNILSGSIPIEICDLKGIIYLDLSNNSLAGTLPSCMNNLTMLKFLYMQHNSLFALISIGTYPLYTLDLRDNNFAGPMTSIVGNSIGANVMILLLGGNYLSGVIPERLCKLTSLKILDNKLDGPIPSCLANITFRVDHSNNCGDRRIVDTNFCFEETFFDIWLIFHDAIPLYKSTLTLHNNSSDDYYYVINKLISAQFTTKNNVYTYTDKVLKLMSGLDLSGNELNGSIPPEIEFMGNINSLNLSHNRLSGTIPQNFSNLGNLESLDLSYNMLSGAIPVDMTKLHFLAVFNVSYNNLSGPTPTTGQFANFGEDNYRGNKGLFGYVSSNRILPPLPPPSGIPGNESAENHAANELVSFYWGFVISFVTVVLGLVIVLWFSPRWCRVWFHFVDLCMYYCFLCFFRNDLY